MDKLKTYAVPIVALLLLLAWFFVIRPMLNAGESEAPAPSKTEPESKQ